MHPDCNTSCPGLQLLSKNGGGETRTRNPTREEIITNLPFEQANIELLRLGFMQISPLEASTSNLASSSIIPGEASSLSILNSSAGDGDVQMMDDEYGLADDTASMHVDDEDDTGTYPPLFLHPRWSQPHEMLSEAKSSSLLDRGSPSANSGLLPSVYDPKPVIPMISRSPSINTDDWYPFTKSESKVFELLYIPDPSHAESSKSAAEGDLTWARREISETQFEAIRGLTGFVYKCGEKKNMVNVLVTEWLWTILQMDEYDDGRAFSVKFMHWNEFKNTILSPVDHIESWNSIAVKDCVIGGIDYSIDHRCVGNPYGLDQDNLETYERNIRQLAAQVQFWPPPDQIRSSASKWTTICHLQFIARTMHTFSPRTTLLESGESIPRDTVLKRSHSDCGRHVIMPKAEARCRAWPYLSSQIFNEEFWMSQEYVETLGMIGEWRAFIIGGQIISVVHTHKLNNGEWSGIHTDSYLTMDEIQELIERRKTMKNAAAWKEMIVNPQHGTMVVCKKGKEEFKQFVMDTWKKLVLRETRIMGGKSSLTVFCRIDIGLKFPTVRGERPQYFVNGVKRTQTTSLWLARSTLNTMGTMADTFAMVFKQWIRDIKNVHIL